MPASPGGDGNIHAWLEQRSERVRGRRGQTRPGSGEIPATLGSRSLCPAPAASGASLPAQPAPSPALLCPSQTLRSPAVTASSAMCGKQGWGTGELMGG